MLFERKSSYSFEDLIACGNKEWGEHFPQLPVPPMLMMDRVTHISETGGEFDKGEIIAEYDINPERWFFDCHFVGDSVMPGCLGLDGMWQLLGFYLGWMGGEGKGRAFGVGEVKFADMVLPTSKRITYKISIKRVMMRRLILATADATVLIDGNVGFTAKDLKVGLFKEAK